MINQKKLEQNRILYKRKKSLKSSSVDNSKITKNVYDMKLNLQKSLKFLFKLQKDIKMKSCENLEMKNLIEFKKNEIEKNYDLDFKGKFDDFKKLRIEKRLIFEKKNVFMKNLEYDYFKLKNKPVFLFFLKLENNNNFFELDKKFILKKNKVKINQKFLEKKNFKTNIFKFQSDFLIYIEEKKNDEFEKELKKNLYIYFFYFFIANLKKKKNLIIFNSDEKKFIPNFPYSLKNSKELNLIFIFQKKNFLEKILKTIFSQITEIVLKSNNFENNENLQIERKIIKKENLENLEFENLIKNLEEKKEIKIYLNFSIKTLIKEITKKIHINIFTTKNIFENFSNDIELNSLIFYEEEFYINKKQENVIFDQIELSKQKIKFLNNLLL